MSFQPTAKCRASIGDERLHVASLLTSEINPEVSHGLCRQPSIAPQHLMVCFSESRHLRQREEVLQSPNGPISQVGLCGCPLRKADKGFRLSLR